MHISKIVLTNWKAYKNASFDFPVPTAGENVVLIGAENGFGKTSLFQAILLGMYGKEGFSLMEKSPLSIGSGEQGPYPKFIERVLHKNAAADEKHVKVQITLMDEGGRPVEIIRTWHFRASGRYIPQDEVQVLEGKERKPIGPSQHEDREEWYRDYIAREFLPSDLSSFFWFDGEKAGIFADHDMADQVRLGITGLLGVPAIKELAEDLRSYAVNRRQGAQDVSDTQIDKLENKRDELVKKQTENNERLSKADPELTKCKYQRDTLSAELTQFSSGGSLHDLGSMHKEAAQHEQTKQANETELYKLLAGDMALALSGNRLHRSLDVRLKSESAREKWETGRQQGDNQLDAFIGALDDGMQKLNPSVEKKQRVSIVKIARDAWSTLWDPPPPDCAEGYRHPYLGEVDRGNVRAHLNHVAQVNAPTITKLLDAIDKAKKQLARVRTEIARLESVEPHVKDKQKQIHVLNSQITKLDQEVGALNRSNEGLKGQIDSANESLGRLYKQKGTYGPIKRKITRAMTVAKVIDEIVQAAVPSQTTQIAESMTIAYREIAHKGLVDKIEIDKQCNVKLLDSRGNDVRDVDASAGEKQIFTQALISAVSLVCGRAFPVVIDTPIARLDKQHRQHLLMHLANRKSQVILLSTNTEVVGEYLRAVDPSVQIKYLIQHDDAGMVSTAEVGYFPDEVDA